MLPGKTTWPGENQENLEQQGKEHDIVGEQVRKTRQFCEESTKDPAFKDFIKQFKFKGLEFLTEPNLR